MRVRDFKFLPYCSTVSGLWDTKWAHSGQKWDCEAVWGFQYYVLAQYVFLPFLLREAPVSFLPWLPKRGHGVIFKLLRKSGRKRRQYHDDSQSSYTDWSKM